MIRLGGMRWENGLAGQGEPILFGLIHFSILELGGRLGSSPRAQEGG